MSRDGWLPPGVTDRDIDEAAPPGPVCSRCGADDCELMLLEGKWTCAACLDDMARAEARVAPGRAVMLAELSHILKTENGRPRPAARPANGIANRTLDTFPHPKPHPETAKSLKTKDR